jgi:hypothetical protein
MATRNAPYARACRQQRHVNPHPRTGSIDRTRPPLGSAERRCPMSQTGRGVRHQSEKAQHKCQRAGDDGGIRRDIDVPLGKIESMWLAHGSIWKRNPMASYTRAKPRPTRLRATAKPAHPTGRSSVSAIVRRRPREWLLAHKELPARPRLGQRPSVHQQWLDGGSRQFYFLVEGLPGDPDLRAELQYGFEIGETGRGARTALGRIAVRPHRSSHDDRRLEPRLVLRPSSAERRRDKTARERRTFPGLFVCLSDRWHAVASG